MITIQEKITTWFLAFNILIKTIYIIQSGDQKEWGIQKAAKLRWIILLPLLKFPMT